MARPASVRWDSGARRWRSDVGPPGPNKRASPVWFRHPNTAAGRLAASLELARYLADRDEARRRADAPRPSVGPDGTVWSVVIRPYLDHVKARVQAGKAPRVRDLLQAVARPAMTGRATQPVLLSVDPAAGRRPWTTSHASAA